MSFAELRALLRQDWADPANASYAPRATLLVFRLGQYAHGHPSRLVASLVWRLADRLYVRLLIGAELPPTVRAGAPLKLPHGGRGVIMHPDCTIGANSMIFHRVTLAGTAEGAPTIERDVTLGVGACVIGPVRVGAGARIGANAVVTRDVAPGVTAVGVPARPLERQDGS
jgi:serine O-acetyltransferase